MSGQAQEADRQHMMLLVELAQQAGRSEREITELVDQALEADADLRRAA